MNGGLLDFSGASLQSLKGVLGTAGVFFEQQKNPVASIPEYFAHSSEVRPKTIPLLENGRAFLWSNRPIPEIINPSLKPLNGKRQTLYWSAIWLANWRCYGLSILQPILGDRLWSYLKAIKRRLKGLAL